MATGLTKSRFKSKKVQFTQVSNTVLRDKRLSLKSKGLFSLIQSYVTLEDFVLYKEMLVSLSTDGESGFNSAWQQLKKHGYLVQGKGRDETGAFYYEYDLIDLPDGIEEEQKTLLEPTPEKKTTTDPITTTTTDPITTTTTKEPEPYTFNEFWKDYNMFIGKSKALKCWDKIKTKDKPLIKTHLKKYIPHTTDSMGQPYFRKYASSYLNQKAWDDDIVGNEGTKFGVQQTSRDTSPYSLGENKFTN